MAAISGRSPRSVTHDLGSQPPTSEMLLKDRAAWRYARYVESPAWQVLTSASSDQRAFDVLANDRRGGPAERRWRAGERRRPTSATRAAPATSPWSVISAAPTADGRRALPQTPRPAPGS